MQHPRYATIYPIHFILGCMQDSAVDTPILLSFNMLKHLKPDSPTEPKYANFLEQVFRIVPRVARQDVGSQQ